MIMATALLNHLKIMIFPHKKVWAMLLINKWCQLLKISNRKRKTREDQCFQISSVDLAPRRRKKTLKWIQWLVQPLKDHKSNLNKLNKCDKNHLNWGCKWEVLRCHKWWWQHLNSRCKCKVPRCHKWIWVLIRHVNYSKNFRWIKCAITSMIWDITSMIWDITKISHKTNATIRLIISKINIKNNLTVWTILNMTIWSKIKHLIK